ncbi:MAG: methylmalonyl Co-A mutase-associated GTPase MeaB [Chloroflexi bacterium]|nr:methylmalonyl Co-A mutase-associated GTPase MeaB [Chloroflexota bacterium]
MNRTIKAALAGDRRAMARLISRLEDDPRAARDIIPPIYAHSGQARVIGVTGAPGSGKSSLVARVAAEYRLRGRTVGIVAVDPTSPFSGGALLGDRIRTHALSGDPGIFFRSMATRGHLGGLARATADVVTLLDACGYERILVETTGAGQSEVDIASEAHTTLVLQTPGAGDDVQALKAGILEIADILVVNKADLDGADYTVAVLEATLSFRQPPSPADDSWPIPILRTVALDGRGIAELVDAVERHGAYLAQSGQRERLEQKRAAHRLRDMLQQELLARYVGRVGDQRLAEMARRVALRCTDPYSAVCALLQYETKAG